jgi:hypothetical protein
VRLLADPIPDGIEPISGYRVWSYDLRDKLAPLHSITCSRSLICPWTRAGSGWVEATCTADHTGQHTAPAEGCSCGIYAMASVDPTFVLLSSSESYNGTGHVLGRVDLAGKIIEHECGYRAERARIAELVPIRGATRDVIFLANRLGVPVAPAIEPAESLSRLAAETAEVTPTDEGETGADETADGDVARKWLWGMVLVVWLASKLLA